VVRNELREGMETGPSGQARRDVAQAVFPPSHAYSRPIIGTHQSLSALTLDDARRFAAEHYRPDRMTMVVVADIDLAGAEALARIAGQGANTDEVDIARGAIASQRLLWFERSAALGAALLNDWNLGWPLSSVDDYASHLKSVTAAQVTATLTTCRRRLVTGLIGDEATIRRALATPAPAAPAAPATPVGGP
jgi:predicted Zn-dependent peptidase